MPNTSALRSGWIHGLALLARTLPADKAILWLFVQTREEAHNVLILCPAVQRLDRLERDVFDAINALVRGEGYSANIVGRINGGQQGEPAIDLIDGRHVFVVGLAEAVVPDVRPRADFQTLAAQLAETGWATAGSPLVPESGEPNVTRH